MKPTFKSIISKASKMSKNSKKPTHPSASDVSVPRHVFTPPTCPICSDVITFKTAVNPLCGHTHCQTCFWKWARKSNSCPFCRQDLIARDREKELEVESLIERRHEMRENLEEMFNEGAARALYLHELQDNIILAILKGRMVLRLPLHQTME